MGKFLFNPITGQLDQAGGSSLTLGTTAGTAAEGNDARLSDSRSPLAHKNSHSIGGTDALAPSDIGAQSLFVTTTNTIFGNTTISAGRALIYQVATTSAVTADISLPSNGHLAGDVIVVRSVLSPFTTGTTLTIKSGTGVTLDTITASNQAFRYTASSSSPNAWNKVLVDTHTHAAADVTSGVFDNARINFAAPAAIGGTTAAAITGTTGTFTALTANNGTLTASAPVLDLSQTWNNAAVTFTGMRFNITNTASASSASGSKLFEIAIDGTPQIRFQRNFSTPYLYFGNTDTGAGASSTSLSILANGGAVAIFGAGSSGLAIRSDAPFAWSSTTNVSNAADLLLLRDAANTLAQRNATNPQTFNIYNTFTSSTNHERGFLKWSSNVFQIGTEAAGTGTARHVQIVAGSNAYTFFNNGEAVSPLTWVAANSGAFRFNSRSRIASPADSVLTLTNNAATDFDRLQFGGTTSSFPALKRSSTTLQVRLADDSAFAAFECAGLTLNGNLTASTRNIVTDTTTGTRIGTATTQLLGFWNATPAVQPAAVADATDAASTQARLNDLLARLRTIGILAT